MDLCSGEAQPITSLSMSQILIRIRLQCHALECHALQYYILRCHMLYEHLWRECGWCSAARYRNNRGRRIYFVQATVAKSYADFLWYYNRWHARLLGSNLQARRAGS